MTPRKLARRLARTLTAGYRRLVLPPKRYRTPDVGGAQYTVLSTVPPIFYVAHWMDERLIFATSLDQLFEYLGTRRAYFLYDWAWNIDEPERVDLARRFERQHRRRYRGHRFVHLCNTVAQRDVFLAKGLDALLCNQNCFIDENTFKPLPGTPKAFDAVYDGRLRPYKRHQLAAEVERLALIYLHAPGSDDPTYVEQTRRAFAGAYFFNHPDGGDYIRLQAEEVNRCLNACRVGLCLSRVEGAMHASIQYLLCGLPVVSTRSKGGRDVFFDDEYVVTVEDRPDAVRLGVQEALRRNVPADLIRRRTLEKMAEHRATLIALVQRIYDEEGVGRSFAAEWPGIFYNRLLRYQRHAETIRLLRAAGA